MLPRGEPMEITPGIIVGGKYRLERPVSRGGMGSVWAAQHQHLGSTVALKFMDPAYAASPSFQARFHREAQVAARIESPHVVKVQDYGFDALGPYIVMELLRGEDLQTRLDQRGRLSGPETGGLLVQLGKALRRAHEAGLIHRDLKPRNLFLARGDEDGEILKVLDFGIAKDTLGKNLAESTSTGELMGSPHYMSPEQLRAEKELDPRSDLWAVGVILFRCLTGRLPFPGDVLGTVMARVLVDPVPLAAQIAPDLPPGIDAFFARALARDPAQRFQSIRELVDAFAQATGGAPLGVTTAGVQMSPFAAGPSRSSLPSAPFGYTPLPQAGATPAGAWSPAVSAPIPAAPFGTPAPDAGMPAPPIAAGTLTSAGVSGSSEGRRRQVWAVGGAAVGLLVLTIGAVTTYRLTRPVDPTTPSEAAAAAPEAPLPPPAPPAEPSSTAAAEEPPPSEVEPPKAAEPVPEELPQKQAEPAKTAEPAQDATQKPPVEADKPQPPAVAQSGQKVVVPPAPKPSAQKPTPTATPTKPSWGF